MKFLSLLYQSIVFSFQSNKYGAIFSSNFSMAGSDLTFIHNAVIILCDKIESIFFYLKAEIPESIVSGQGCPVLPD
jgi:hypothetical protein